jgi:hypothetical protein
VDIEDIIRLPDPRLAVRSDIREVVADLTGKPSLFVRVKLSGWHFPERAKEPFMLIGRTLSRRVLIAPDGSSASGYFDQPVPDAEMVSFGYGRTVAWDFPVKVSSRRLRRLDRGRLGEIDVPEAFR